MTLFWYHSLSMFSNVGGLIWKDSKAGVTRQLGWNHLMTRSLTSLAPGLRGFQTRITSDRAYPRPPHVAWLPHIMVAERWSDLLHGNSGLQEHVPVHKAAVGGLCGPSNSRHGCVTSMAFYWLKQVTSPPRFKRREGGPLYLWQVCQDHITEEHGVPWPYLENTICTGVNMNKEEEKQSQ